MRGIAVFRTIYYLPGIVPAVANAVLWAWILNSEFGLLNAFLHVLWRNGFQYLKMGYVAALAWVLAFIITGLTVFIFRGLGRRVHYEEAG